MSFAVTAVVVGAGASIGASYLTKPKPKAEAFNAVDLQAQQGNAIGGNIAAFKPAAALAGQVNTFNAAEIQRMNELAMPGYSKMQAKGTANIMDWMSGKVPADVSNAARTGAAGKSLFGGYGGTGMGRNLEARDLGLTSLDVMSKGMDSATKWMQLNKAQTFDVSSMFLTPGQTANFATSQRDSQLAYQNSANAYDYTNSQSTQARNQLSGLVGQLGSGMANYLGTKSPGTNNGDFGGETNNPSRIT
jgi:hypothetical protein